MSLFHWFVISSMFLGLSSCIEERCDSFKCFYPILESGVLSSTDFSEFSNNFFLAENGGSPKYVYIGVNVTWLSCDDNISTYDVEYVWGHSPSDAIFGPVHEVFHFSFHFDPLVVIMSWMIDELLVHVDRTRDVLPPWLSVEDINISIDLTNSSCIDFSANKIDSGLQILLKQVHITIYTSSSSFIDMMFIEYNINLTSFFLL